MPTEIRFEFVNAGESLSPQKGKLILDVGNKLESGIVDHHHLQKKTCTTREVFENKNFITDWIKDDKSDITIVLHKTPDIDAVVAAFLTIYFINDIEINEKFIELIEYVEQVDQGLNEPPNPEFPRLYELFEISRGIIEETFKQRKNEINKKLSEEFDEPKKVLLINEKVELLRKIDLATIESGFELIEFCYKKLSAQEDADMENAFWSENPFKNLVSQIKVDRKLYEADLSNSNIVRPITIKTPSGKTNIPALTDGLYWFNPQPKLFKLWARTDLQNSPGGKGFQLLFIEWPNCLGVNLHKSRFIISVDPKSNLSLKGLGEVLNHFEKFERDKQALYLNEPPRNGYEIYDPWYDGRTHDYTIVDTPFNGTLLEPRDIENILSSFNSIFLYNKMDQINAGCKIIFTTYLEKNNIRSFVDKLLLESWEKCKNKSEDIGISLKSFLFNQKIQTEGQFFFLEKEFSGLSNEQSPKTDLLQLLLHESGLLIVSINVKFYYFSAFEIFRFNSEFKPGTKISLLNKNLKSLENKLQALSINLENATVDYTYWNIQFNNGHKSRDEDFYSNLLNAFSSYLQYPNDTPIKLNSNVSDEILGQYGYLKLRRHSCFLFLNRFDSKLSTEDQNNLVDKFNTTLWYIYINGIFQISILEKLNQDLQFTVSDNLYSRRISKKLQKLREEATNFLSRTVNYNLSTLEFGESFWFRISELFNLNSLKEKVLTSIHSLAEFVDMNRKTKLDNVLITLSILIGPLTLLTDYLGGILSQKYSGFSDFLFVTLLVYSGAMVLFVILYFIFNRNNK